jgi:uncharacterized protein YjiK
MRKNLLPAAAAVAFLVSSLPAAAVTLTQLGGAVNISNGFSPAFREASGLAVSKAQTMLWSITDQNCTIYQMTLSGSASAQYPSQASLCPASLSTPDFEGVTYGPPPTGSTDDHYLYLAMERQNAIVTFNYQTLAYGSPVALSSMTNWDSTVTCDGTNTVADEFNGSDVNSGLEGITWNGDLNSFFVVKEKSPGLIIRISKDLSTIQGCKVLAFAGPNNDKDYSDISYDSTRQRFWILSDEAQAVYLYNWSTNSAAAGWNLGYSNAEGVAYNPSNHRLYIATDNGNLTDSYLYTYDVQ